jgi:N-terminal domain of toast_rack, DUF2154
MADVPSGGPPRRRRSSLGFAMCLIAFGIFFLILNLRPDLDLGFYVYHFWPVIFILLGVAILFDRLRTGSSGGHDTGWIVGLVVFFLILAAVSSSTIRHHHVDAASTHNTSSVDLQGANSVIATLEFGAGEVDLVGGAQHLMDGDFSYPEYQGSPHVNYYVSGSTGNLSVREQGVSGIHFGNDDDSHWNLKLANDVPIELNLKMGAGEGDVHAQGLELTRLDVQMGAGEFNLDLTGPWKKDLNGEIHGGVGEATIRLPKDVGVMVHASGGIGSVDASGLHENGDEYTNDAYGKTPVTIHLNVEGGIGQINLICEK